MLNPLDGASTSIGTAAPRRYTTKQMGDACEMIVAAELTLAGIPALKVPDNWPGYDVIAQPFDRPAQRVSVKSRTFKRGAGAYVGYNDYDQFDWLAIVLLPAEQVTTRAIYLIPRPIAEGLARRDKATSKTAAERYFRVDQVPELFSEWKANFELATTVRKDCSPASLLEVGGFE
ncbi:hypothetical protein [Mesorhizobium sangaii]|uniref:Uncharacterized protein n=1 Tax=Mesorhizobium sangaii TaxID=505389 RepID=A0A841PDN3_9HYPH|nr:hypothetical protein [Mesorhizobium sangaii]MBB6411861.1 hypothetical protein [Mesorhizobium sangaii]